MFPSSGYFKGIDCPFFASGLCDRPNCHFRHKEESSSQVPVYIPTAQSKPPSLLGLVGIATKQLSRTTPSSLHSNGAPQYIPTPISVLEQLKKQKTSESPATLQRVTLGDIAQFSNEELHADSASTAGTAVDFCPNKPRTSDLKRKFDELEHNAEESVNLKKVKSNSDVAELSNRMDSTCEPCPSGFGVVSLPPKSVQSLKKDSNLNNKNEKIIAKEKPVKKSAEIISADKDDKKTQIKTNVIKKDSSVKSSTKTDKCQNKNASKEAGFKSTGKDAQLQKASSSSSSLIGDIKRLSNKLDKESEAKKSDTGSCKVKSKLDHVLKSKEVSKKSQINVESLKIAESIQLEMDLFGNPLSGGNQKNEKADDNAVKQNSKNGVTVRTDKQIAKDGRPLKQSINSSKGAKTYEPSKHVSKTMENAKRASSMTSSSNGPSVKRQRNNSCQQLAPESCFSNSDMEPSDGGGIDDDDDDDGDDDCRIVDDDDDDDDVTSRLKECYKIFMEPQSKKPKEQHKLPVQPSKSEEGSKIVGKRRIAHQSASNTNNVPVRPKNTIKDHKQVMIERLNEAKQRRANEIAPEAEKATSKANDFSAVSLKGSRRIAHVPSKEVLKRPMITYQVSSGLVPINHRLMQLNKIIDKCLEIYDTQQDAYTRSLEEEKKLMTTCPSKFAYNSRLVSLMINLNREVSAKKDNKSGGDAQLVKSNKDCNFTFNRCGSMEPPPLTEREMYQRLKSYILTEDQLKEHGFPFKDPETNAIMAIPNKKYSKDYSTDDVLPVGSSPANRKICCRCNKEFVILKNGNYLRKEECVYHWGPYWKKRVAGNVDHRYNCCGGSAYDRGCEVAEFHVHEDNKFVNLTGFVSTLPCSPKVDDFYGIYALDCEMIYTVAGCELARITVIDFNLKVVYDKLVKPDSRVVDYNTRFSGIKKEDMEDVRTTLRDVQAVLLTMFNDKTILIGHSLENDLLSLKLLHQNIVDTSVVFPHKLGFPYKRALRNLSVEILKKTIQQNLDGHDSKEDASACMELMMQKVKEDMKRSMRVSRDQMLSSSRSFF